MRILHSLWPVDVQQIGSHGERSVGVSVDQYPCGTAFGCSKTGHVHRGQEVVRRRDGAAEVRMFLETQIPFSSTGRPTLATTSDRTITPAARQIARARAGNGEPLGIASGSVRTPASVTAPRTPARDTAATSRQFGLAPPAP